MSIKLLVTLLVILVFVAGAYYLFLVRTGRIGKLPYRSRSSVFNKSEAAFYHELIKLLPPEYQVFPKMRIIDFIKPERNTKNKKWHGKIWAKHVDFLICNRHYKPVVAIEVDGSSHQSKERQERDHFVARVYKSAELKFVQVPVGSNFAKESEQIVNNLETT